MLKLAILNHTPLRTTPIGTSVEVFMYIKNYCHFSRQACGLLMDQNIRPMAYDLETERFVQADNWSKEDEDVALDIKDVKNLFIGFQTVPQIFVKENNVWYYVGGCSDLMGLTSLPSTILHPKNKLKM